MLTGFLVVLLVQFLVPSVKEAVAERDRLEAVSRAQQEAQAELKDLKQAATERRDDVCPGGRMSSRSLFPETRVRTRRRPSTTPKQR